MIAELTSSTDPRVPALLDLAHRSFPPATREPDEQLLGELDGQSTVPYRYLIWDENGVAGFIRYAQLSFGPTFVVHLAVESRHQGKGIGTALLKAAQANGRVLFAEVEPGLPMDWWLHVGAHSVTDTYTQPALRNDTLPYPLTLMAIGEIPNPTRLIEAFYKEVWNLPPTHGMVQKAVKGAGK